MNKKRTRNIANKRLSASEKGKRSKKNDGLFGKWLTQKTKKKEMWWRNKKKYSVRWAAKSFFPFLRVAVRTLQHCEIFVGDWVRRLQLKCGLMYGQRQGKVGEKGQHSGRRYLSFLYDNQIHKIYERWIKMLCEFYFRYL